MGKDDRRRHTRLVAAIALIASTVTGVAIPAAAQEDPLPRPFGAVEWTRLSSDTGDLEPPFGVDAEPTDAQILDVDGDGVNDFVVTNREGTPSGVWYRRHDDGWERHVFEPDNLVLEAGGTHHDVDGDGDLDIVVGEDSRGNRIHWWENPSPNHDPAIRWTRHLIKDDGPNQHHDVLFGDVDGDGVDEFVFWNDLTHLRVAEIPADPTAGPWAYDTIWSASERSEGLAIEDMDLDGDNEIIGAGRIFTHVSGTTFDVEVVDPAMSFTRAGVGQLIPGGRPELVFVVGDSAFGIDGFSYMTLYEWQVDTWAPTQILDFQTQNGHSLTIADFNGDTLLDIFSGEMILNGNDDAKGLLLYGDGTGAFEVQEFSTGFDHHQSLAGDLDGDGDYDILGKPFSGPPGIDIWINTAVDAGTLPLDQWIRHSVDPGQDWLASHAVWGDFNSDGHLDIASGGWWYENPQGDYAQTWTRRLIGAPFYNVFHAQDVDGDGLVDLLGTDAVVPTPIHPGSVTMYWAQSHGDGTFTIHDNITPGNTTNPENAFVQGLSSLGPDAEGNEQLAISWNYGEFGESGIDVLTIPADPVATTWPLVTISPISEGEELPAGDIDGDGDLDLFLGSGWLRNDGAAGWTHFESTTLIGNETPYHDPDRVALVDVDDDGDLDAVVGLLFFSVLIPSEVVWLENPGSDPTGEWPLHLISDSVGGGFAMDVDDIDNDGDPDVILGEHVGDTRLLIFENVDDATSWNEIVADPGGPGIDHHDGAQLVDFDNDGDLDVVSLGWHNTKVWLFENTALQPGDLSDITPPDTPTNVTADAASSSSITVRWDRADDDRGVAFYRVFRDGVEVATTAALTLTDTGLAPDATHSYVVQAEDASGNRSGVSDAAAATTPTPDLVPPTPPLPITTAAGPFDVTLTWSESTDDRAVVEYVITRDGAELVRRPASVRSYANTGLTHSTAYQYVIQAIDADGNRSDLVAGTVDITTEAAPEYLWAAYGFEGAGAFVGDSGDFANDGALLDPASRSPIGRSGQAFEVNGISGGVDLDGLDVNAEQLTVMAWINADDFGTQDARIVSKADGIQADDHTWMLSTIHGQGVRFRLKTNQSPETTTLVGGLGQLSAGTWHHVAASYDGAFMRLFVDGVQVASTAKSGRVALDETIGTWIGANPTGDKVFDGRIDDVKIFVVGLDEAGVAAEMAVPVGPAGPDDEAPTAPTDLVATADGPYAVDLAWNAATDNVGVVGYDILDGGSLAGTVSGSLTTFRHTGLAAASSHSYTVAARDAAGNETSAGPVDAATGPDLPPMAPTGMTALPIADDQIAVSWSDATDDVGIAEYRIERDGGEVVTVPATVTSYLDGGLAGGTTYAYTVVAVDSAGQESAPAGPVDATTPAPDTEAPSLPGGVSAVVLGLSSVEVSWSASTDNVAVVGYRVLDGGVEVASVDAAVTSFVHDGLAPGSAHSYTVIAVDGSGNESAPAGPIDATTEPDLPPSAPGDLSAVAAGPTQVDLDWTPATDDVAVADYVVRRDGTVIATVAAPATEYTDTSVLEESSYAYTVTAIDDAGNESPPAGPANVTTPASPDDLLLAYDFNDPGPTITDRSGNTNNATLNGTATTNPDGHPDTGTETHGLELDGTTTGHADLANLDLTGNQFTISAWINLDTFNTYDARIISKADGTAANNHLWMLSTLGNELRVRLRTDDNPNTTTLISNTNPLTLDTWHFIAATYDGTTLALHVDGTQIATTPTTGTIATDPTINTWIGNNPTTDKPLDGHIDTLRIHTRALTTTELQTLATTPISDPVPDAEAPSLPGGVSAVVLGLSSVEVSWSASTDNVAVVGYRVLDGGVEVASVDAAVTSFVHDGLAPGSAHSYTVIAVDGSGNESAPAGPIDATTEPDLPPSAPGDLSAVAAGPTQVDLDWTPATDDVAVADYVVRRDGTVIATVAAPATEYTDTSVLEESSYAYTVTAIDDAGNESPPAGPANVTTPASPDDLLLAYDFNDPGPTITDRSGNTNNATLNGTATTNPDGHPDTGTETHGLELDGTTTGHADLANLDLTGNQFTISAWINLDTFNTYDARIISKADGTAANNHLWMLSTLGNELRVRLRTDDNPNTTTLISNTNPLTLDTWHFIAATYDGTTLALHVDGTQIATTPTTGTIATDPTINTWIGNNPTTDKPLDGHIDTLRIHTRALTTTELQTLATTPISE